MKISPMLIGLLSATLSLTSAYSQSQAEMNETAFKDFEKADARLNAIYKKTLASLDADGKKKLIASERAWIAYRDAEADLESDTQARGGSMMPLINSNTATALTEARIKELGGVLKESSDAQ